MNALETELTRLQRDAALSQSVEDVDKILEQLCRARDAITAGEGPVHLQYLQERNHPFTNLVSEPNSASITLAKLQNPVKQGFERVTEGLKKVYAGHNKYGKALDKVTDDYTAR
jgi:E3 ubiquitin-protein transferase RMND5